MITLDEAIESAKVSAGQERILRQQHYDDLLQQLSEEDHYPFTMALVELDIGTRTGTKDSVVGKFLSGKEVHEPLDPHPFIEDRIVRAALQRNAGWWDNLKEKVKEWTGWGEEEAEDFIEEEYGVAEPPPEPMAPPGPPPEEIPTVDEEIQEDIEEGDELYPRFEEFEPPPPVEEVVPEPYAMPVMHPVESSNLEGVGYDEEEELLYIAFRPKRNTPRTLYRYFNVPAQTFSDLLNAESKGKYFHRNVREVFPYDGPLDVGAMAV